MPNLPLHSAGGAGHEGGCVCIFLYVGSGQPLPIREWVPPGREIEVSEATRQPDVDALFSRSHVYSIGTRLTGDGCGFQGDHKEARRAREELAAFLERALGRVPELELFVACDDFGDSGVRPRRIDWVGPNDIRTWISGFRPEDFLVVIPDD